MLRVVVFFLAAVLLVGCAPSTEVTSFVDPDYRGGQRKFGSVAVFAHAGLEERQVIEDSVVAAFAEHKVRALRGIDIILPTRQYTDQEWVERVRATGVDAVLFIGVGGKDVSETYVPPTYIPGTTQSTVTTYGNTAYVDTYQTPGYTIGGYMASAPISAYSASLVTAADGATAWKADATASGDGSHSFNDLSEQVAKDTVAKLVADGLF